MMTQDSRSGLKRARSSQYLEGRGFRLAEQTIAPAFRERAHFDEGLRQDLPPVQELLRPHVFASARSRDAACRSQPLGDAFVLMPINADDLVPIFGREGQLAVGPRIDDPEFAAVAEEIIDPQIDGLIAIGIDRDFEKSDVGTAGPSTIITVAGAHYELTIDGDIGPQVRAKAPFDCACEDDVARTAAWIVERAMYR